MSMKEYKSILEFMRLQKEDVDVYNDCLDTVGVAYCPRTRVTKEGRKEWEDILHLPVTVYSPLTVRPDWYEAVVHVETEQEAVRVDKFFWAVAGYVSSEEWERWFEND